MHRAQHLNSTTNPLQTFIAAEVQPVQGCMLVVAGVAIMNLQASQSHPASLWGQQIISQVYCFCFVWLQHTPYTEQQQAPP